MRNSLWQSLSLCLLPLLIHCQGPDVASTTAALASPQVLNAPEHFDCSQLDYGIYWYGKGNVAQKAVPGTPNRFFDVHKPTVIYAHGWQSNSYQSRTRENFAFDNPDIGRSQHLEDTWIDAGWNVGIFYWTQFADEYFVQNAEYKMWTPVSNVGMRWRTCDGSYRTAGSPSNSIADLYFQSYVQAMRGYQGDNIRLIGHSLGSQLALRLADLVAEGVAQDILPKALLPKRVTQLDPWWSGSFSSAPGIGAMVAVITQRLKNQGMIFEMFKSSDILALPGGDLNPAVTQLIGETKVIPGYIKNPFPTEEVGSRHVAAPKLYFLSLASSPPKICTSSQKCDVEAASAATSDERTRDLMREAGSWIQSKGEDTATSADDEFVRRH
ncbi:MAG: hypothetical protein NTZ90_15080 [Proteobacteria bacterium]|nr:hypothetical protein [Pseudomonadota bacterium]